MLIGVTEARARVGSIQATPELVNDPQAFQKFEAAQGQLSQALKSLIAVSENYPQLKSDQNFRDLQAQLEGTENRITVARNRYIQAVQEYNVLIRSFPTNLTAMVFKYPVKQNFTVARTRPRSRIRRRSISAMRRALARARRARCGNAGRAGRRAVALSRGEYALRRAIADRAGGTEPDRHRGRRRAQSLQPIPKLEARVTDLTGTLTAAQQAELEQKLRDFEARKGAQIAVLLVPTTAPEEIEQYSIRVVEAWKLGRKRVDDGALLIIAKNDRAAAHRERLRARGRADRRGLATASSRTRWCRCCVRASISPPSAPASTR